MLAAAAAARCTINIPAPVYRAACMETNQNDATQQGGQCGAIVS